jgi:hypothetical protein
MRARTLPLLSSSVLLAGAMIASGTSFAGAAPSRSSAVSAAHLAGHHWTYKEQIDGKGGVDRVVIDAGKDLTLNQFGPGSGGNGHFTVHVHLAGTTRTVSARQELGGYLSPRKSWTPFYGATNLNETPGKEILVGFSTGAHTQTFTALAFTAGHLSVLPAPGPVGSAWLVNSSFGTGSDGWLCTSNGVQSRSVIPANTAQTRFRVVRNTYVYRSKGWVRTHHFGQTVKAKAKGVPPKYTDSYPNFACPGLPKAL